MSNPMISAKYPLLGTEAFLEISIGEPELDPESSYNDWSCECKISAQNFEKKFHVGGVDELQCVWIALRQLRVEISNFENETSMKCEYRYFQEFED